MNDYLDLKSRIAAMREASQEFLEIEVSHTTWQRLKEQASKVGESSALIENNDEPVSFDGVRVRQNRSDKFIVLIHKKQGLRA